jgi:hypothetical protein
VGEGAGVAVKAGVALGCGPVKLQASEATITSVSAAQAGDIRLDDILFSYVNGAGNG